MKKKHFHEYIALIIYMVLNLLMTIYHEPWFDEAESWLIARDASYFDILFVRPHYEGHPPFWHLILSVPAKLGAPYEFSIKGIQFAFAVLLVWLILFRSPFPQKFRLFLPFSFFFFYQYGVIARPYAMLCVAMFLLAEIWESRDRKPWPVVLLLLWICLSSAHGIIMAGGMTAVWVLDSLYYEKKAFFSNRKRLCSLIFLLLCAFFLMYSILPYSNTHAMVYKSLTREHGYLWQLLFFLFVIPSETIVTSCSEYACIFNQRLDTASFIATGIVSLAFWTSLILICNKRNKINLLLIPYILMSLVGAGSYFNVHHFGLLLCFLLSILWICFKEKPFNPEEENTFIESKLKDSSENYKKLIRHVPGLFLYLIVMINLFWSASSFYCEIRYKYSFSRDFYEFIKDNDLEQYRWFASWEITRDKDDSDIILLEDSGAANITPVPVNPYLSRNLIYNMPSDVTYVTHEVASAEKTSEDISKWAAMDEPDFILSSVSDFPVICSKLNLRSEYNQITISEARRIWKADLYPDYPFYLYIRSDLKDEIFK